MCDYTFMAQKLSSKARAAKKDAAATNIATIFDSFVGNTGKTQEETDKERDERDQQIFSTAFNLGQNNATPS